MSLLQAVTALLALLGVGALVVGCVVAYQASRKAPEGYEDEGGFHLGDERTAASRSPFGRYWFGDQPNGGSPPPACP